jgi:DNA polymerase III alpha subunit
MASIPKMTAFCKELQHKDETSQIGLFDIGGSQFDNLKFSLEKAPPMSYEERIRGEKLIMGYSVSGHGLDGLKKYVHKRTIGLDHVKAFQEKMKEKALQVNLEEMVIPSAATEHHDDEHQETTGEVLPPSTTNQEIEKPAPEEIAEVLEVPQKKEKRKELPRIRFM